jgi:hypothetical protein
MAIPKFLKMVSGRIREAAMTALEVTDTLGYVPREKLSAARTYYVRTDGNDANTGLVDSAAGAFLTIQKAVDVATALDNGGYAITIQVGAGTYPAVTLKSYVGSGLLTLLGDASTPANVTISTSSAFCIAAIGVVGKWAVNGFTLTSSSSGGILVQYAPTTIELSNIVFGSVSTYHMMVYPAGLVSIMAGYSITGGAAAHYYISRGGCINASSAVTVTVSNTPAITVFASVSIGGLLSVYGSTFTGSATGTRYAVSTNGVIRCGASATFFPGDTAGTTATGGQYA